MNKAFLDEQAGVIAAALKDGVPCPVCGSTEHPHPALLSQSAPTEADVKTAKQAYEKAQTLTEKASSAASTQKGIVDTAEKNLRREIAQELGGVELEAAQNVIREKGVQTSAQIRLLESQLAEIMTKEARRGRLDELIPQSEAALADAQRIMTKSNERLAALAASVLELSRQIDGARAKLSHTDKAAAQRELSSLKQSLAALAAALKLAQDRHNAGKEALAAICAAGDQLRKQLEDEPQEDADALEKAKAELTLIREKTLRSQKEVHARMTANAAARRSIADKARRMSELETRYAWMKALAETANGNLTGKEKIMLETYIQTTYFDRILERANLRLRKMSGGQYDLRRRRAAGNRMSQSGLELDIVDHINATERSVNTLSGGESFMASLALALGLSDEVQMSTGIRLNTLFVDEGFGSLDSEALSKAYSTLAGLTQGNRLVGIISHVTELKERIDKQILVTKNKSGASEAVISV